MSEGIRPGEVTIRLDDEDVVLQPSARALDKLDKTYGGLLGVIEGLSRYRLQTFVDVIAAGTNAKPSQREQLPGAIYKTGVIDLLEPLTRFVNMLGNGGRPAKADADADAEDEGDPGNG